MKIIGQADGEKVLIEASRDEVAQIMGPGYRHVVLRDNPDAFKAGTDIPVSEMWQRLNNLSRLQRTLGGVSKEMRDVADWLDTVPEIIEPKPKKKTSS